MTKRKELFKEIPELTVTTHTRIRFNETDSLGIVWHGNYITYFEDGREAFGRENGISYLDVIENGYSTPIIRSECDHKLSLKYGDIIRIETTYVDSPAAKLIFRYKIYNEANKLVCKGETIQVFVDLNGDLSLNLPEFFENWKRKVGLIK